MGKKKYIETPERFWELFLEYKSFAKDNPLKVHDFVGKDGQSVYRLKERPLTIEGFENYVAEKGVISDLGNYFANTDNAYNDYLTICSRVKRNIRQDQIEGGMASIYNPSITQRLNNLTERTHTEVSGGLNIPNLPDIGNR